MYLYYHLHLSSYSKESEEQIWLRNVRPIAALLGVVPLKEKNTSGLDVDIKGSGRMRFQAVIKRLVDRNVHISGVTARGRDPSSRFHSEKWTSGTFIFCLKSALVLRILMSGLSVLWAKLSLHFVRVYFFICSGTQPHICYQETSIISVLASKNNPSGKQHFIDTVRF